MALKKCKECGHQVSTKAKECPSCGAQLKRKPIGCGGLLLILIVVGFFASMFSGPTTNTNKEAAAKQEVKKTPSEIRKERISNGFSPWDGSHYALTKLIKKAMNDPKSYEHEETTYGDKGDHLIVKTVYRGRNAFGGMVKAWIKVKCDLDGNVLAILEEGP